MIEIQCRRVGHIPGWELFLYDGDETIRRWHRWKRYRRERDAETALRALRGKERRYRYRINPRDVR